jgi:hypothetical protein
MAVEEPDTLRYRIAEVGLTVVKGAIKWFPKRQRYQPTGIRFPTLRPTILEGKLGL